MKEFDQQIALWNWLGWRFPCPSCHNNGYKDRWRTPDDQGCRSTDELQDTLNTNSLDVLHSFEEKLNDVQKRTFAMKVHELTNAGDEFGRGMNYFVCIHADEVIRRKALLKTLNLWREDSNEVGK